ncbi:hypothetical protein C8A00DRAFT_28509 [Chaetomidium leptoderma]|uniref:Transposase Tc1-like domain-containing protein n=1 Tax=Chaetomidium leptoderma TaxID=669021 RepID=A0AAN7A219_9PEZI|nr:hypothetical protein C8A00DRAFT_28509 [Chaetomidium leptoderma]
MGYNHLTTAQKSRIQGTVDFLRSTGQLGQGQLLTKENVFRHFNVSHNTGHRILRESRDATSEPGRFHSNHVETRGRKKKLDHEARIQIERCIDEGVFDGRTLPWDKVPAAAGLDVDVSAQTVRRVIGELNFRRCISCETEHRSKQSKEKRVEYSRMMLEKRPEPRDWWHVRFSDTSHFGWDTQGKISVSRRPWERFCPDCLFDKEAPAENDTCIKRLHCWAAVGHDFKSDLVWDEPGPNYGKMTTAVYRDQILEPIVGSWLLAGHSFVLEEETDSGYGGKKSGEWKQAYGLQSYFNCPLSPDFVPIERAWQGPKQVGQQSNKTP